MTPDDDLHNDTRRLLDESVRALDPDTVTQLYRARIQALNAASGRRASRGWRFAPGLVATGAVALGVALWLNAPFDASAPLTGASVEDLDLLTAKDSPDFFAELEFYSWLAGSHDAS